MPTIGHGEDGLTYHALHARRAELLRQLHDGTAPGRCLVYFRPSFGRAGGPFSPLFGEFDSILCTDEVIYLIESKWSSGDRPQQAIVLLDVQRLRHLIFIWLYENWRDVFGNEGEGTWAEFVNARGHAFTEAFPNRPLAPVGTLLARNLRHILSGVSQPSAATQRARLLKNLLIHFHPQVVGGAPGIVLPAGGPVVQPEFHLVNMTYEPLGTSRYFDMAD
jgi:hypothetical protein